MAAPPLLLPSLSILFVLSFSSVSYCSDEGTTNSPTTKDAIIQYWNLKFPNKPLPSFFTTNYDTKQSMESVAVNYDSDSEAHGSHATANYGARGNHATANYNSDSEAHGSHATANYGAQGNHLTANYDSDSKAHGSHATANYGSRGNHLTANYDSDSEAHGSHATANYGARGNHATANYNSDSEAHGSHATANYGARGNHITANYNSDSEAHGSHATANYGARGNHITASYASDSEAHGSHATANYGARGNHATANYNTKPIRKAITVTTKNDASNPKAYKVHSPANNIRMVSGDDAIGKVAKGSSNLNVFFRESNLTRGTIMPMCDIKATMPQMPFLPRSIATMLPFSSPREVKKHFRIPENSRMSNDIDDTISNCNSTPSKGETKACITSAEDLIDFIRLKLGPTATLKNTESAGGSEGDIIIGEVKSVKGDKLTEVVACHQAAFPYMVYLCHSVPMVKIYEADILDAETKEKINHGIAICHFDTSNWSEGHVAFIELGFKPGEIEACHWIFDGEMAAFAE